MTENALGRLPPIRGRASDASEGPAADVSVEITNLSFRETSKGKRYPYGEFGSELLDALHKQLVGPGRRGFIRSTRVCRRCDTDLTPVPEQLTAVAVDVALRSIPPIHLEIVMPGLTCPSCHLRMVRIDDRDIASDLSFALMAAFQSVGFGPG
jgi:hypothetical protein